MPMKLWRGDTEIGILEPRAPSPHERPQRPGKPPSHSWFLIPSGRLDDIQSMWQHQLLFLPDKPVKQHVLEVDIVAERAQRAARASTQTHGTVELTPMSASEMEGVPFAEQFLLEEDDGPRALPAMITLQETRLDVQLNAAEIETLPPGAVVNGSVWTVHTVMDR